VLAVLRDGEWRTGIDGHDVFGADDLLLLQGHPMGMALVHELAGVPFDDPRRQRVGTTDADQAAVLLMEMKMLSEVAVGLGYAALLVEDRGVAGEVRDLAGRLDQMKDRVQRWVLQTATAGLNVAGLQALLQLAQTAEDLGDRAEEMVRPLEDHRAVHPVLALALGETQEVAVRERVTVDGRTVRELRAATGFDVLAVRRGDHYLHRPPADTILQPEDVVFATGPDESRALLAQLCGNS
jgi:uncharacterized protein with PhoU and TrkA domain